MQSEIYNTFFLSKIFGQSRAWSCLILVIIPTILYSQDLRINEFMALNSTTLTDSDGEYSDWIEIYNPTASAVDLQGWSLTDDENDRQKWIFPRVLLPADSFLLVFASGKNRSTAGQELHTSFKLSGSGEYLALADAQQNILTEFLPVYPEQQTDISYGYYDSDYIFLSSPTPGTANQVSAGQLLFPPSFSHPHGFYDEPFMLEILTDLNDADIFFTLDGSDPSADDGILYTTPILINTTAILRAIVFKPGPLTSKITTSTYLFLDDVINQTNDPPGYPAEWGPYTAIEGTAIADYEMDTEITQDPRYMNLIKDALLSIPTMSIVTDKNNLFSKSTDPDSGGIYIYTGPPGDGDIPGLGDGWERPASVEFFGLDRPTGFQVDCGLRIHGGHSRRPEKTPKHSFRVAFRSQYGMDRLNYPLLGTENVVTSFNTLILRATYGNTWLHMNHSERRRTQLIHDLWAKDTQLDMGQPSGHGAYVHLYLNGLYWGIYNPTERIDKDFAGTYLGGDEDDYDVIKDYGEVVDGNTNAWNSMMNLANAGLDNSSNYQRLQGKNPDGTINPAYEPYVDLVNFIDYMIINFYGGNWDWDHHNWIVVRNRVQPGTGFKFFSWDAEHILEDITYNTLGENNNNCPSRLFQCLRENADFRRLLADRVQLHCYNSGVLTPQAGITRLMNRAEQIELAVIAESARWGDYRRDVHRFTTTGPFYLYDKEYWLAEQSFINNEYFPQRTGEFIAQLRAAGLFPLIDAPQFLLNGQPATSDIFTVGDIISMTAPSGDIYYTIDGTDPWLGTGISPVAILYAEPIQLMQSMLLNARAYDGNEWSALNSKMFGLAMELSNLKITEIHYHPLASDTIPDNSFEFIELKNTGQSPLDLSGIRFGNGLTYNFPVRTVLPPRQFIVLAADQFYFAHRYGFTPFAEYQGQLDNGGEQISILTAGGDTLLAIHYQDEIPWPESADGGGFSLVPIDTAAAGDPNDPVNWRASYYVHGSPGRDDKLNTEVEMETGYRPFKFELVQNYPNPFNPLTTIRYSLSRTAQVKLIVYNVLGEKVRTLVNLIQNSGEYSVILNAMDNHQRPLPSGIYFYVLKAGDLVQSRKMLLIK
jgi:hypothetical protein